MSIPFDCMMVFCLVVATIVWLIRNSKRTIGFPVWEKMYSVTSVVAFPIGLVWSAMENDMARGILCLIGFVVSEFAVAVTFYENCKDLELPI